LANVSAAANRWQAADTMKGGDLKSSSDLRVKGFFPENLVRKAAKSGNLREKTR
jgi:hypothetical protein